MLGWEVKSKLQMNSKEGKEWKWKWKGSRLVPFGFRVLAGGWIVDRTTEKDLPARVLLS
jgi:hypothetical protein